MGETSVGIYIFTVVNVLFNFYCSVIVQLLCIKSLSQNLSRLNQCGDCCTLDIKLYVQLFNCFEVLVPFEEGCEEVISECFCPGTQC